MNKKDLEELLKFAEVNDLMQRPFDEVYDMWRETKTNTPVSSNL